MASRKDRNYGQPHLSPRAADAAILVAAGLVPAWTAHHAVIRLGGDGPEAFLASGALLFAGLVAGIFYIAYKRV